jgi:hypothetical protein
MGKIEDAKAWVDQALVQLNQYRNKEVKLSKAELEEMAARGISHVLCLLPEEGFYPELAIDTNCEHDWKRRTDDLYCPRCETSISKPRIGRPPKTEEK